MKNIVDYLVTKYFKKSQSSSFFDESERKSKIQKATCAILVHMAKIDEDYAEEERLKIISIMAESFDLDEKLILDLLEISAEELEDTQKFEEVTTYIADNFHFDEKYELVKSLWCVMLTDSNLHLKEKELLNIIAKSIKADRFTLESAKKEAENRH